MTNDKKPRMAERATWPLGGLVLKDFTIRDPGEDDEEGLVGSGPFSMQKRTTNSALKRGLS